MKNALTGGRFGLVCALLGLAGALASGACPGPAPKPRPPLRALALGGVTVERLERDALPRAARVQGRAGDWTMTSDQVRLVVGRRGALIDLAARAWDDDALEEVEPVVTSDGAQQVLEPGAIEPFQRSGRAALRVTHHARSAGLALVTEIAVAPGAPFVELESRLENIGRRPRRVRLGDRVVWSERVPFAPGVGFVESARRERLSWFARPGSKISYAFVLVEGPEDVEFVTTVRGPAEQIARSAESVLAPGATLVRKREIAVVRGELPRVAALAWTALGQRLGTARGTLAPMPEWARLEAKDTAGRLVLAADVGADGRFELPLPRGRYALELVAPGGRDAQSIAIEPEKTADVRFIVPEAARIAYRVTDAAGAPISARLVVRGVEGTKDPVLGPVHLASGAGNVAYTKAGEGALAVPPGKYELVATAGIEWTIAEATVDVDEKRGATFRGELERVVATPGWTACDFHLHADPSGDSDVPLPDRVLSLLAEGIEFAAATDHNHVTDYSPAVASLGAGARLVSAVGVEITTSDWGHFNTFPYPADAAPPPYAEPPVAIFDHVRRIAPGAIVQINHPRMPIDIGYFDRGGLDSATGSTNREGFSFGFDTIEVWNGFDLENPDAIAKNLRDWYGLLDLGRVYTAVGNSDSHMLVVQWTGYPRTYVQVPDGAAPAEIAQALRAGRALVTNGPFLELTVEGTGIGGLARTRQGRLAIETRVRAAPWVAVESIDLVVNGTVWQTLDAAAPEPVEIELERDGWLIAIARGSKDLSRVLPKSRSRPFAFTNPVFVDVDENGKFDAPRSASQKP